MSFVITFFLSVLWFFEVNEQHVDIPWFSLSQWTLSQHETIVIFINFRIRPTRSHRKRMFVRAAYHIMSIDRIISELYRRCTVYMSIYDRQVIAQAFSRTPIPTNPIALAEEAYSWPQLFLYSNSDTLIPASVSFHFFYANSAINTNSNITLMFTLSNVTVVQ